jgi:hypothetical protein
MITLILSVLVAPLVVKAQARMPSPRVGVLRHFRQVDEPRFGHLEEFRHGLRVLYLKTVLIATLYHLGQLSEHEACVALGLTRRVFEDLLARFGFSVLADDQATIDVELHV